MEKEAGVRWECVEAEAWTVVAQQAPGVQVAPEVSEVAGVATAEDSEGVEWKEGDFVDSAVEDLPLTEWVAEVEEEWAPQVERWI